MKVRRVVQVIQVIQVSLAHLWVGFRVIFICSANFKEGFLNLTNGSVRWGHGGLGLTLTIDLRSMTLECWRKIGEGARCWRKVKKRLHPNSVPGSGPASRKSKASHKLGRCKTSLIWTHTDFRFHFKLLYTVYCVCVTHKMSKKEKRSSWFNCALWDDKS